MMAMRRQREVQRTSFHIFICIICFSRAFYFLFFSPGAVVLRLAKSWFRIGSVEILAQSGEIDLLR